MGLSLAIITDPEAGDARVRAAEALQSSTKWLVDYLPAVDAMATVRRLTPLGDCVYKAHPSEYDPSWEEGDEIDEDAGAEEWHSPADALRTIEALIQSLKTDPAEWRELVREGKSYREAATNEDLAVLLEDLGEFHRCLALVHGRKALFYLAFV